MEEKVDASEEKKRDIDDDLSTLKVKNYQHNICHIEINLKKVNDEEIAVEFTKIGGDSIYFHESFKELAEEISRI
jgi:hypothetical protein